MRPTSIAALLAGFIALTSGLARAQTTGDPEAHLVDELVVTAPSGGPAWWRVSRGDSTVWILGTPSSLPKGFAWDQRLLDRRLGAAREVILPPVATAGVFDVFGALSARAKMRGPAPLEVRAPPALRTGFLASAARLGRTPGDYDRWNGVMAGIMMSTDFRKGAGLDIFAPLPAIRRAAARRHVPVAFAATYKFMPVLKVGMREFTPPVEWACLGSAIEEIEGGSAPFAKAAQGWATGDVKAALLAPRGFESCFNAIPAGADMARRSMTDDTAAIEKALASPGQAVAVVSLRTLLAEGGVLSQLRAAGYEVKGGA
jgi:hypothetical protein